MCQKPVPRKFASVCQRNALPGFHLRDPLRDRITILLAAEGVHRLPMRFTVDNDIDARRVGVDDFQPRSPVACNAAASSLVNLALINERCIGGVWTIGRRGLAELTAMAREAT